MKNKILIIFIIIIVISIVIFQIFINRSFADSIPAEFKLNQVETNVGEKMNIEITLVNEKELLSCDFEVKYDVTKFKYISYKKGNIQNFTIKANEIESGVIKIAGIQDPAQPRIVQSNTTFIILQFDVLSGSGTQSNLELECNSLYTSETEKAQTITNSGNIQILDVSSMCGNINSNFEYSNVQAYLYKKDSNALIDESVINETGSYKLDAKELGEYYIKIKKPGYLDYYATGINITQLDNTIKYLNDIQLVSGDVNDDEEIEILDLVKINENIGIEEKQSILNINFDDNVDSLDRKLILDNYGRKANIIDIESLGFKSE